MQAGRTGMFWTAVSVILFGVSCNVVMENRRECPCTLSVRLEGLPAYPVTLLVNDSVVGKAHADTTFHVWVETGGTATVTAVSGADPLPDLQVRIPYGEASPPLYVFRGTADCTGESAFVQVHMQKHFCTLSLRFAGLPEGAVPEGANPQGASAIKLATEGCAPSDSPVVVAIRGSVNGYSLVEGEPLQGAFRCRVQATSARIPRHRPGDPLWLDITLQDSVLRSFPLGTYLEKAGYDWTAPDLPDRDVEMDISVTSIRFRSDTWSTVCELDLVI